MSWRDRDYAREGPGGFGENPLMWLFYGRVPLFKLFNTQVTLHASFIVVALLIIIFGSPFGASPQARLIFVLSLFLVVLLHEFGHVFGARASGGESYDIEMTPLGGLAFTMPQAGAKPLLITVACGPLVNVLICLVLGVVIWLGTGYADIGPFTVGNFSLEAYESFYPSLANPWFYLRQIYGISYYLLLFNLLPIYPLDGGKLLHGGLWLKLGYYKSLLFTTAFGMVGCIVVGLWGLAIGSLLLTIIMVSCFINCLQTRRMLQAEGPWAFQEEDNADWKRSLNINPDEPDKVGVLERVRRKREEKAAEREAMAAQRLEAEVDRILAKISQSGIASLTTREKRTLDEAREAKSRR